MGVRKMNYVEILTMLVRKTSTCWIWQGSVNSSGYGQHGSHKKPGSETLAHRKIYTMLVSPIPRGMQIDHLCRNRLCVNPEHLEVVDPKENLMRSPHQVTTINSLKTHCKQGHEFNEVNTRIHKTGKRECIPCKPLRAKGALA